MDYFFAENVIKALTITFVHSLWQGLAIALIAAVFMRMGNRARASTRYALMCFFLLVFVFITSYTLYAEYRMITTGLNPTNDNSGHVISNITVNGSDNWYSIILQWCANNATILSGAWLLVFSIKTFLFWNSINKLQQFVKYNTAPMPEGWQQKLKSLSGSLKVKVNVSLHQSSLVAQPMVVGIFKPVIIIPVGLITQLTEDEAEAILLHELAHIKRSDYLVNILQCLVENVFFFNPGLLWMSAVIRKERECCCDFIAIEKSGDKKSFLQALLYAHEFQSKAFEYALKFGGNKSQLVHRVSKIVNEKKRLNEPGKICMGLSIVLVAFLTLSFSTIFSKQETHTKDTISKMSSISVLAEEDTLPAKQSKPITKPISTKKKIIPKENSVHASPGITPDTLPTSVSKEFMEGYQMGMKYSNSPMAADEKTSIERGLIGSSKPPELKSVSAQRKRQIEKDLLKN